MRLLAIGNMYPPHHLGGYELAWRSAMSHVRDRGHTARVLTADFRTSSTEPDDPDTYRELRWYWHDHGWPRIGWRGRVALERHNAAVLGRHLDQFRPDVVSWWSMGGMSLSLIERVRRRGIPAVAFVHDDWLIYGPKVDRWIRLGQRRPLIAALLERLTGLPARVDFESAAAYLFVSEVVRAHARAAGHALADSSIAHSGIDDCFLDPRPERAWEWRVLYVGRLDERKGVVDTLVGLTHLPQEATLSLAGTGDTRTTALLRDLARRRGVAERVHELGMLQRRELIDVYESSDVVVFPVRWEEPWGLVPLEAMALGRPVIATGRGGSREYLVDGVNALLVPSAAPTAIAQAVRRLASDPELRMRIRMGGLQTSAKYTESAFNQRALDALLEAASQHERERRVREPIGRRT